jgi:hypothetical protein
MYALLKIYLSETNGICRTGFSAWPSLLKELGIDLGTQTWAEGLA